MSIPNHHSRCITKTFPTSCPDCQNSVFFFSCNCGSKIFFEELGAPWPIHYCKHRPIREAIELLRLNDRLTDKEIYEKIDALGYQIPEDIIPILDFELGKRRKPLKIKQVNDLTGYSDISGKVMEINKQVSFRSRLKIDLSNSISIGLAGDLAKNEYAEIFLRENPDSHNESKEFKIYIKSNLLKKNPVSKGKIILGLIAPIKNHLASLWELVEYNVH